MTSFVRGFVADADNESKAKDAISSLVVGTKQQESYVYDANKVAVTEDLTSEQNDDIKDGVFTVCKKLKYVFMILYYYFVI